MKINSPTTKDSEIKRKWAIKKSISKGFPRKKKPFTGYQLCQAMILTTAPGVLGTPDCQAWTDLPKPQKASNSKSLPSRKLTYPTLGKGKSSSKCHFWGDMLVPWRVPLSSSNSNGATCFLFWFGCGFFPRRLLGAYLPTSNKLLTSSRSTRSYPVNSTAGISTKNLWLPLVTF